MARKITRDDLVLMIEELDRGEAERSKLKEMVEALELVLSDADAVELLRDDELSAEEVADRLVGYSDLDA